MSATTSLGLVFLLLFSACDSSSSVSDEANERGAPDASDQRIEPLDLPPAPKEEKEAGNGLPVTGFVFNRELSIGVFIDKQGASEPIRVGVIDARSMDSDKLVVHASDPADSGEKDLGLWSSWDVMKELVETEGSTHALLLLMVSEDGERGYEIDPSLVQSHLAEDPRGGAGVHFHLTVVDKSRELPPLQVEEIKSSNWPE